MEADGVIESESKPGVLYLSSIPRRMNVKHVRQIFSEFGEVGRIFLQPNSKPSNLRKPRSFTEGWVEFTDKRVARKVAASLNNSPVGGKRRNPWYSDLWNIKYLPRFSWGLLNERLTYERAIHKRRLRTEVTIAKRETAEYIANAQRVQNKRKKQKGSDETVVNASAAETEAPNTISVVRPNNNENLSSSSQRVHPANTKSKTGNNDFLANLFSGGL